MPYIEPVSYTHLDKERETFRKFRVEVSGRDILTAQISAIMEDDAGDIWLATHGQGLFRIEMCIRDRS